MIPHLQCLYEKNSFSAGRQFCGKEKPLFGLIELTNEKEKGYHRNEKKEAIEVRRKEN